MPPYCFGRKKGPQGFGSKITRSVRNDDLYQMLSNNTTWWLMDWISRPIRPSLSHHRNMGAGGVGGHKITTIKMAI